MGLTEFFQSILTVTIVIVNAAALFAVGEVLNINGPHNADERRISGYGNLGRLLTALMSLGIAGLVRGLFPAFAAKCALVSVLGGLAVALVVFFIRRLARQQPSWPEG